MESSKKISRRPLITAGVAFFSSDSLLRDGQPVEPPKTCDYVFATIDTAIKTGKENDGTAVVFWALDRLTVMPWKLTVLDWDGRGAALAGAALLVNTTKLGMSGQPPLELDLSALPVAALVADIVYNPLQTRLLAAARARGNGVVDGLGMLLHQARPAFQAWFDCRTFSAWPIGKPNPRP